MHTTQALVAFLLMSSGAVALAPASAPQDLGSLHARSRAVLAKREAIAKLTEDRATRARTLSETMSQRFREVGELRAERDSKVAELAAEKEQTRRELAAGLYCSQCKRSKSKIERQTKKSFAEHLKEVRGRPIPMGPEAIAAEMARYDQRIAELARRYDERIARKSEALLRREQALKDDITRTNLRLADLHQDLRQAEAAFGNAVAEYRSATAQADADWHARHQLAVARLEARQGAGELRRTRQIQASKARLAKAIADREDQSIVDAADAALRALVAERKSARGQSAAQRAALEGRLSEDRRQRAAQRATEEAAVAELVRATTGGSYAPMGLQVAGAWSVAPASPTASLRSRRDAVLDTLDRIRSARSRDPDDDAVLTWANRAQRTYRAMQRAASRVREFAEQRARIAQNNLRRLRDAARGVARLVRDELGESAAQAAFEEAVSEGWENMTVSG
ncbi:MAG: hypothetical protein KDC87_13270, partial [Planctomycetes bacterium]|nr:hypothetical protein [Planctomycetota bacterium]